jgi:hypothetical protein
LSQAQCGCNGLTFIPDIIHPNNQDLKDLETSLIKAETPVLNIRDNENNRGKSRKLVNKEFRNKRACCGGGK